MRWWLILAYADDPELPPHWMFRRNRDEADALAAKLRGQGMDVTVEEWGW